MAWVRMCGGSNLPPNVTVSYGNLGDYGPTHAWAQHNYASNPKPYPNQYPYGKITGTVHGWHNVYVYVTAIDSDNNETNILSKQFNISGEFNTSLNESLGVIPSNTVSIKVTVTEFYGNSYVNNINIEYSKLPV